MTAARRSPPTFAHSIVGTLQLAPAASAAAAADPLAAVLAPWLDAQAAYQRALAAADMEDPAPALCAIQSEAMAHRDAAQRLITNRDAGTIAAAVAKLYIAVHGSADAEDPADPWEWRFGASIWEEGDEIALCALRDLVRLLRTAPLPDAILRHGDANPAEAAKPAAMEVSAAPPPDDPVLRALKHAEAGRRRGERALALDRDLAQLSADVLEIRFALRDGYLRDEALADLRAAVEAARQALDRAKAAMMKEEAPTG